MTAEVIVPAAAVCALKNAETVMSAALLAAVSAIAVIWAVFFIALFAGRAFRFLKRSFRRRILKKAGQGFFNHKS